MGRGERWRRRQLRECDPETFGVIGPSFRLADGAALPFPEVDIRGASSAQKHKGKVGVGCGKEAGDTWGIVEAVCEGAGCEDCSRGGLRWGGAGEEGGGDEGMRVEVASCEGVGGDFGGRK